MKIVYVFLFISVIINCYSCNENSTENNYDDISLIPFKMNNYWEYRHTIYDSSGSIIISDTILNKVIKDTTILNQHYYRYQNSYYYTIKEDGIWEYEILSNYERSTLFLKYPCKVGDTYTHSFGRPNNVTVISLNEKIIVEAGEFSCITYQFKYDSISPYVNTYVSPRVGIIKHESFSDIKNGQRYKTGEESLLRYQLN